MKTNNNFHILIVDDEKFNIELAAVYLQEESYKVSFAMNAKATLESVMKYDISLILLDINMPGKDGFAVCEMLKSEAKTKDIPIIFLTAQTDIEYISRAFEVGGADYISKPFNGVELKARVKTQLQNLSYLEEIKNKQSKLAQLSITDPLTKLHNALYFDAHIKAYLNSGKNFWILYFKVNRFEKINNLYGFSGANKILRKFSSLLEKSSISGSVVAKLYGVSFAIVTKDYDHESIKKAYESLLLELAHDKDLAKSITISTVLYNVRDSSLTLPAIYKKLQTSVHTVSESEEDYLVII